jgi:hypothetical protein
VTEEVGRRLIDNVWVTNVESQGGSGGGGITRVTSDDETVTITNPTGPTVDLSANGGSQPGILAKDFIFTEGATAGTYSASFPVLAGTFVLDMIVYVIGGPWAADTAVLNASDTAGGVKSYYNELDLTANGLLTTPYDNGANSSIGVTFQCLQGASPNWASAGLLIWTDAQSNNCAGVRYIVDDTVSMELVTTIGSPPVVPAGITLVRVLYIPPVTPTAAVFA